MSTPWAYGDKGAFVEYMTTHLQEQPGNQVQDIAPVELYQMLLKANDQGPVVLDVREPWEYRSGHVPGAILIPLG